MSLLTPDHAADHAHGVRRRLGLPVVAGIAAALLLAVLAGLTWRPGPEVIPLPSRPAPTAAQGGETAAAATRPQRRTFANLIARTVEPADVPRIVADYAVVVLNDWDREVARLIKQTDPGVTVLMYQCLSSTRSSDRPGRTAGGVLYQRADPQWFAVDTAGRRVEWNGYDHHWQMKTWDTGYQRAWVAAVLDRVAAGPWDGVLADNDYDTMAHYSTALLEGTGSTAATDQRIRDGLDELVELAGAALNENGKLLVPNVSEGRYDLERWRRHSAFGGAMEENFVHFGTDPEANLVSAEWRSGGWRVQADQVAGRGLALAVTQAAADDRRSMRYGYATLLVMGDEDSYWMTRVGDETYTELDVIGYLPEAGVPVGRPLGPPRRHGQVYTRTYERVWVAVNPNPFAADVTPPKGARTLTGQEPGRTELEPHSGLILLVD